MARPTRAWRERRPVPKFLDSVAGFGVGSHQGLGQGGLRDLPGHAIPLVQTIDIPNHTRKREQVLERRSLTQSQSRTDIPQLPEITVQHMLVDLVGIGIRIAAYPEIDRDGSPRHKLAGQGLDP
jgi:hypothetical protein